MQNYFSKVSSTVKNIFNKFYILIKRFPFISFLITLGMLLLLILLSYFLNKPEIAKESTNTSVKKVNTFNASGSPEAEFIGVVLKKGVVELKAQTNGIISKVYFTEGKIVNKGSRILSIASNYSGESSASISKELAIKNYQNLRSTYKDQLDVINKSIEIAKDTNDNSNDLLDITKNTIRRNEDLIDLNEDILDSINSQILNTIDQSTLNNLNAQKAQILSALNQIKTANDSANITTKNNSNSEKISENQKDIAIKNLEVSKKALDLSLEISKLQLNLANLNENLNNPASPIAGSIEEVLVKENDAVNAGDKLAVIKGQVTSADVSIYVPQEVARIIDSSKNAKLTIDSKVAESKITSISTLPVNNNLYLIKIIIPQNLIDSANDKDNLKVKLPLKIDNLNSIIVPIDAVYQTQSKANLFLAKKENDSYIAQSADITLGKIYGDYIEVLSGLNKGDIIITERNVNAGEKISL